MQTRAFTGLTGEVVIAVIEGPRQDLLALPLLQTARLRCAAEPRRRP